MYSLEEGRCTKKRVFALVFRLNITADDDLILNAHYEPLKMLIVKVTNNCRRCVFTAGMCKKSRVLVSREHWKKAPPRYTGAGL